jgi:hypothetical protein
MPAECTGLIAKEGLPRFALAVGLANDELRSTLF